MHIALYALFCTVLMKFMKHTEVQIIWLQLLLQNLAANMHILFKTRGGLVKICI